MGAWGTGIFEDDHALDLLADVCESDNPKAIFQTSFTKAINADYLDADDGQAVIVSAVCIDNILNQTQYPDQDEVNTFGEKYKIEVTDIKADAIKALHIVLGDNSELNELWAENEEDYPAWKQNIDDLTARLQ